MPTYELQYFNARGRAELSRLMFAAANVKYTDTRYEFKQWPQVKPKTPLGQLPCLIMDGEVFCQSKAIAAFLAAEFGLISSSPRTNLDINMVADTIADVGEALAKATFEKDEKQKGEMMAKIMGETMPKTLKFLEGKVPSDSSFFAENRLTLADLTVFTVLQPVVENNGDLFKGYPKLQANHNAVKSLPRISAYLKGRPKSDF